MKINLTGKQANLLWEMLMKSAIPGELAEEVVGIKQVLLKAAEADKVVLEEKMKEVEKENDLPNALKQEKTKGEDEKNGDLP